MRALRLRLALDDEDLRRIDANQTVMITGSGPRTGYARGLDRIEIEVVARAEGEGSEIQQLTLQGGTHER